MNRDDSKLDEYIVQERSEQMRPLSESFVAKFFSVQSVLVSLCLFGIICSGVAASAVSEVSCDEALGDTRDGSTLASRTCFTTAENSLEVTVFRLLGFSAQGVEGQVAAYLGDLKQEMRKMKIHVDAARDANMPMGLPYLMTTLDLQYQIMKSAIDPAVSNKALQSQIRGSGVIAGPHFTSLQWYWILQQFYTFRTRGDRPDQQVGQISYYPGRDGDKNNSKLVQWEMQTIHSLEAAKVSRNGYLLDGEMKWSNPALLGQFLGYQIVQRHAYPGEPDVETNFFVSLENVNNFFRLAGIRLQAAGSNTSHPRVFGVVASSWIHTATKVRPNAVLLGPNGQPSLPDRRDLNNRLVGVSHGVGTLQIEGGAWGGAMPQHQSMLRDINATDSIIAGISLSIHAKGGYDVVKNAPHGFARLTISRNVNITEIQYVAKLAERGYEMLSEDHYAGVRRFDDKHGIDWWIVHSLDVVSIMKEVEEERVSSQHTIKENNNKIADKIDDDRRNTKLIVAGVALAIVLVCIFVVNSVISPIKRVQNAMSRVALMDLESKHSQVLASSKLFEVRQMQKDFIAMVKSLKEFRAYVPSSLFEGESEEGSTVHAPSGNVAVFFSDIQSSTALWRRNAADMNIAIELHNDVFRKHYREHEAYEVKTIGDAFMCVFQSPEMAMKYALRVQRELVKQKWPESLELGKGGLVVRMGVNYGDVILEKNPVTGRSDYRGSTVNMASRLEGKALGGTVCVSSDFIAMLKSNGHWSSCGISGSKRIGMEDLKGLGSHELHIIAPETLERRLDAKTTDCVAPSKKEDRKQSQLSAQQQNLNPESDRASESHVSSTGGLGDGGRKARKTGLQLSKNSVTVAVCRLVWLLSAIHTHSHSHSHRTRRPNPPCSLTTATSWCVRHAKLRRQLTVLWPPLPAERW